MNIRKTLKLSPAPIPQQQPAQPLPDELSRIIASAHQGVFELREQNDALTAQVSDLERDRLILESKVTSLEIQLEAERSERRHYNSLANELITRLDVVGRTVDEVIHRAQQEAARMRNEPSCMTLPELKIPEFLKTALVPPESAEEAEESAS